MLVAARKLTKSSDTQLRVWLATSCDDARFSPAPVTSEYQLAAFAAAGRHCAGLMYMNQYMAGGSFVVGLEGHITPADGAELTLRIGVPQIPEMPGAESELTGAILAGLRDTPPEHRPMGILELTRFYVHTADFKTHRWKIATPLLCLLLSAKMTSLLERNASDAELWAAVEGVCPEM